MTSSSKIKEALQETKTILTEQGWTQNAYFSGDEGERCFCLTGAVWKAATGRDPDTSEDLIADHVMRLGAGIDCVDRYYEAIQAIGSVIRHGEAHPVWDESAAIDFNDADNRELSDIIEVLDTALEKLND